MPYALHEYEAPQVTDIEVHRNEVGLLVMNRRSFVEIGTVPHVKYRSPIVSASTSTNESSSGVTQITATSNPREIGEETIRSRYLPARLLFVRNKPSVLLRGRKCA